MVSGARSQSGTGPHGSPAAGPGLFSRLRAKARKLLLTVLIGSDGAEALRVGRFRLTSGQVSYRMYDRYSLGQLFRNAGLVDVSVATATESGYPLWSTVNLDVSPQGLAARPHSLIMEGRRAG
jgi:hypothetical protein